MHKPQQSSDVFELLLPIGSPGRPRVVIKPQALMISSLPNEHGSRAREVAELMAKDKLHGSRHVLVDWTEAVRIIPDGLGKDPPELALTIGDQRERYLDYALCETDASDLFTESYDRYLRVVAATLLHYGWDLGQLRTWRMVQPGIAYSFEHYLASHDLTWERFLADLESTLRELNPQAGAATPGGMSAHIAGDRWTLDDYLGYDGYAHAIFRFLTHAETIAPLAISIQAPWGGGKSSLMRMIQSELDPGALASTAHGHPAEAALTLREMTAELDRLEAGRHRAEPLHFNEIAKGQKLTIWLNAWKYQNSEQVWAGLAEAIVTGIADRLAPKDRERFWLQLQINRMNTGRIRREAGLKARELFLTDWWKWFGLRVAPLAAGTLLVLELIEPWVGQVPLLNNAWIKPVLATAAAAFGAIKRYLEARAEAGNQIAAAVLSEGISAPDFTSKLGTIHHVEQDVRSALNLVPAENLPLVIFIDDLDRCSPATVAEVVQAVNLFLAGDFEHCIFIVGLDPDMVATALEVAHKDVMDHLSVKYRGAPLGWRFMDKFIQLPFVVPPPMPDDVNNYLEHLLEQKQSGSPNLAEPELQARMEKIAASLLETPDPEAAAQVILDELHQGVLNAEEAAWFSRSAARLLTDHGAKLYSDRDSRIRSLVLPVARSFSNNPREIKRFLNTFRFYWFLRLARRAHSLWTPSEDQVVRWVTFSLRWPQAVSWVRNGSGELDLDAIHIDRGSLYGFSMVGSRLRQLEQIAAELDPVGVSKPAVPNGAPAGATTDEAHQPAAPEPVNWVEKAATRLRLESGRNSWLADPWFWEFFRRESRLPEQDRLSAGAGRGLW